MNRTIRTLIALLLALSVGGAFLAAPTAAQKRGSVPKPTKEERERARRAGAMNPAVGKKLAAAQELIQNGKPAQAIKELESIEKRRGVKPIELATMNYLLGYTASAMENPELAIEYFTKAIRARVLPIQQELNTEYVVAQLYMMQEDFDKALRIMRAWFKKTLKEDSPVKPGGSHYYMLALCYMQIDDVKSARRPAELAIAKSKNPQEQWMRLLGQIYYLEQEYEKLARVVEELIVRWPKADYYKMLSGAYAESGQELKSLAVLQLAYAQGITTTESEIRHLAQSYLFHEIPYQAAVVMEEGFENDILKLSPKNLSLLGDSWLLARQADNAFEPLSKAAQISQEAKAWEKLAQAYVGREKWAEADAALTTALDLEVDDPGATYLLQGLARMNMQRWSAAEASFNAASRYADNKATAESYKLFLKTRKEQWEALN